MIAFCQAPTQEEDGELALLKLYEYASGQKLIENKTQGHMSCKVGGSNLARCHKDGIIINIIAQWQTHIKTS